MRRVCAFVIFDITGDPPMSKIVEATETALKGIRVGKDTVTGSDAPAVVFVSSKHDVPMPDNLLSMVDFKQGKPS